MCLTINEEPIPEEELEKFDKAMEKFIKEVKGQEAQILDAFYKAYVASTIQGISLTEFSLDGIKRIQLNQCMGFDDDKVYTNKFWFSLRDEDEVD